MEIKEESDLPDWEDMHSKETYPGDVIVGSEPYLEAEYRGAYDPGSKSAMIQRPPNQTYWVRLSEDVVIEFSEGTYEENKNDAHALAVLVLRSGGFEIPESESMIPVKIAAMGKPAIATFMDVVNSTDREKIAELLDVAERTVDQYISKFRYGRR